MLSLEKGKAPGRPWSPFQWLKRNWKIEGKRLFAQAGSDR